MLVSVIAFFTKCADSNVYTILREEGEIFLFSLVFSQVENSIEYRSVNLWIILGENKQKKKIKTTMHRKYFISHAN